MHLTKTNMAYLTSLSAFINENSHLQLRFRFLDNQLNGRHFYCSFYDKKGVSHELQVALFYSELFNDHALSIFESNVVDNVERKLAGEPDKWNEETTL